MSGIGYIALTTTMMGDTVITDPPPPTGSLFSGNPTELTWTEYPRTRVDSRFSTFIHYQSNFATTISDITPVGTASEPLQSGSKITMGSGKFRTSISPKVNYWAIEMVITNNVNGSLGPCLVKDDNNYVAASYNQTTGKCHITINGVVVMTKTKTLDVTNLKLTLTLHKNAFNFWATESGGTPIFIGHVESTVDYGPIATMPSYYYGIYSTGSNIVTSLKAGAVGGSNIFNQRFVRHSDGKPYIYNGKYLITGDWTALGVPAANSSQSYRYAHQCVFTLDINTRQVACVGHIYVKRTEPGDSTVRFYGGQDMKLTYYANRNQFLLTTVLCDHYNINTFPQTDDPYIWLNPSEVFSEVIVDESRFNQIGIDRTAYPNLMYDYSNILYLNGMYYIGSGETDVPRGQGWNKVTPILFYGPELNNITNIVRYPTTTFLELVSWAKLGGVNYLTFQTFGDNNNYAFTLPDLTNLGRLQINTGGAGTNGRIGGFDFLTHQHDGITEYYLMGFDTEEVTLTDVDGVTKTFIYSLGKLRILKANEQSTAYEFP